MILEKIEHEVLALSEEERIILTDKLIQSLTLPIEPETQKLWADEAERRIDDLDAGKIEGIDGQTVINDIRKSLI